MNISYDVLHQLNAPTLLDVVEITDFLYHNLGEYRDSKSAIGASLDYAFAKSSGTGGFVVLAKVESKIVGACIINTTAMKEYIPSNTLVYIAVDEKFRGNGIATNLINRVTKICKGGIALHVEPDNPAKKLYEKLGFTNKYLEMRFEN